jgi:deoxyribodipyrimidine photolyase-related protein
MKNTATLIYPHQLFRKNPALDGSDTVFIIEEPLLFSQYRFHKQKLVMHRASMKFYAEKLTQDGKKVRYIEFSELLRTGDVAGILARDRVTHANFVQPVDNWLETRLSKALKTAGIY